MQHFILQAYMLTFSGYIVISGYGGGKVYVKYAATDKI